MSCVPNDTFTTQSVTLHQIESMLFVRILSRFQMFTSQIGFLIKTTLQLALLLGPWNMGHLKQTWEKVMKSQGQKEAKKRKKNWKIPQSITLSETKLGKSLWLHFSTVENPLVTPFHHFPLTNLHLLVGLFRLFQKCLNIQGFLLGTPVQLVLVVSVYLVVLY